MKGKLKKSNGKSKKIISLKLGFYQVCQKSWKETQRYRHRSLPQNPKWTKGKWQQEKKKINKKRERKRESKRERERETKRDGERERKERENKNKKISNGEVLTKDR